VLADEGESAASAALRVLRALDPAVVFAAKRAVRAVSSAQESREFERLWGGGAHAAAFAAALSKSK